MRLKNLRVKDLISNWDFVFLSWDFFWLKLFQNFVDRIKSFYKILKNSQIQYFKIHSNGHNLILSEKSNENKAL